MKPTNAFAPIQQSSSVFDVDPFDVEALHADTNAVFKEMVERAITSSQRGDRGRMLLVLGDTGTGKTHLLRGFRRHVQEYGHGFVAYAQLNSASDDYPRYLLQNVIDSLSRPYSRPSGEETGLHRLANGLPFLASAPLRAKVARLREDSWDTGCTLVQHIQELVNNLLEQTELSTFDPDLLQVLLYALCPDRRILTRVYKYLRCEPMTESDRHWIGDVAPRTDKGDPDLMIRQLGKLAFATQNWSLVIMIDQAELSGFEPSSEAAFRKAVSTLHGITNDVPSAIAVVTCLSDLYTEIRNRLNRSALDRLEKDPPPQKLQSNRSYGEIKEIVATRLTYIFDEAGIVHRPGSPTFPFPDSRLRQLQGRRTRDILEWCHEYQTKCAVAGEIIDDEDSGLGTGEDRKTLDQIATLWDAALQTIATKKLEDDDDDDDDDDELAAAMMDAARAYADENSLAITSSAIEDGCFDAQLKGSAGEIGLRIAIANKSPRGGGFGTQIEDLIKGLSDRIPVAVRTVPFPRGPVCAKLMDRLSKATGRSVYIDEPTLRLLLALRGFKPRFSALEIAAWRARDRPVSTLQVMTQFFDFKRQPSVVMPGSDTPTKPTKPSRDPKPAKAPTKATITKAGRRVAGKKPSANS